MLERALQRRVVQTLRSGSPVNQRIEKPCQLVRERPALNANRIAIATGTIDQKM